MIKIPNDTNIAGQQSNETPKESLERDTFDDTAIRKVGRVGRIERTGRVGRLGRIGKVGRVGRVGKLGRVERQLEDFSCFFRLFPFVYVDVDVLMS